MSLPLLGSKGPAHRRQLPLGCTRHIPQQQPHLPPVWPWRDLPPVSPSFSTPRRAIQNADGLNDTFSTVNLSPIPNVGARAVQDLFSAVRVQPPPIVAPVLSAVVPVAVPSPIRAAVPAPSREAWPLLSMQLWPLLSFQPHPLLLPPRPFSLLTRALSLQPLRLCLPLRPYGLLLPSLQPPVGMIRSGGVKMRLGYRRWARRRTWTPYWT